MVIYIIYAYACPPIVNAYYEFTIVIIRSNRGYFFFFILSVTVVIVILSYMGIYLKCNVRPTHRRMLFLEYIIYTYICIL